MLKTPFGVRKNFQNTYIYKYNSVVVIVGGVNMLKTPLSPANISTRRKDKPVKMN